MTSPDDDRGAVASSVRVQPQPKSSPCARRRAAAVLVDGVAVALPAVAASGAERGSGEDVRSESEPIEVVEDCSFELGPRPLAVVVLDSEQDPGAEEPRGAPDVFGVQDVTEVQVARSERARIWFSLQWAPMVARLVLTRHGLARHGFAFSADCGIVIRVQVCNTAGRREAAPKAPSCLFFPRSAPAL